jgi:hypothetical protein
LNPRFEPEIRTRSILRNRNVLRRLHYYAGQLSVKSNTTSDTFNPQLGHFMIPPGCPVASPPSIHLRSCPPFCCCCRAPITTAAIVLYRCIVGPVVSRPPKAVRLPFKLGSHHPHRYRHPHPHLYPYPHPHSCVMSATASPMHIIIYKIGSIVMVIWGNG